MFTELHARSAFSFHRGATPPEALIHRAAELGYPALAITDRDGVYGSARAHAAANDKLSSHPHAIHAITGAEITLEDETALPLLVASRSGYQNLCRMLTRAKLRAPKNESRVTYAELEACAAEASGGLIALTGDEEGPIRSRLEKGYLTATRDTLTTLKNIFGKENLYVELQRHYVRGENWTNACLIELAQTENLPTLATNGACFAFQSERPLYDAFTCLRCHTQLDIAGSLLSHNAQRFLKSPQQMAALFVDIPEAIDNTQRLADRLTFDLTDLGYQFPKFPVPSESQHLREKTYAGARQRYGERLSKKVRAQLDHELRIITKLGFCGYFLIVWDIVNFAREQGILVQGRGSAANSAVCYSLGITACDPIGYELLFERFLSEGRESWPDIDLDLPSGERRETVIQEVYRRFAPRGAAMTANVITYRGKSAIREMGKVLGFPETLLGRFSDLYGGWGGGSEDKDETAERLKKSGLVADHPRLPALLHLYNAVRGLPRHLGQHSGGMIISDTGLDSVVPLENASMPGRRVVQWDKDDCEDLGIIKVDLLGLGMMAAIQDTITLCNNRPGRAVDIANLPKDDPQTYAMIQKADTIGVFQIESRAQMATLPRLRPRNFYDICVSVAIIRPGPIAGGLVHPYINRRKGREAITYIHESFEPILRRTLGIPLFQEQVLQMAMVIADFTGSQAEELRRAISFKRSDERMQRVLTKLCAAMSKKSIPAHTQDEIVKAISSFALYGFPESHAISFALLAYASSWLKAHRAAEFYTALLNNQPMGFYSPATLLMDATQRGITIRPVCVTASHYDTTVEDDTTIRLGLRQVNTLSATSALRIHEQQQRAPWHNMDDFLRRAQIDKTERRTLAKIGALNALAAHRRDALWHSERQLPQGDLFSPSQKNVSPADSTPSPLPKMQPIERLAADYEGLNLSTGPHPMAYIRKSLPNVWRAVDLDQARNGQIVLIAGLVICRQRPSTASGHMFISLEDETGISNVFVPSNTFQQLRLIITQERFLQIKGRIQIADNVISIYTLGIEAIPYDTKISSYSHDFH